MRVLYFAWLREAVGRSVEDITPPDTVRTAGELMRWLRANGTGHAAAFAAENRVRCAVDQEFCSLDATIAGAREVAFFPPVTGG